MSGSEIRYLSTEQSESSDAVSAAAEETFESALEDWILSAPLPSLSSSFFFVAWDNCCDDRELR